MNQDQASVCSTRVSANRSRTLYAAFALFLALPVKFLAAASPGTYVVGWGDPVFPHWNPGTVFTNTAAGGEYSLGVTSDGTVVCWGNNAARQAEVPAGLTNVTAVAGGWYHSLALKSDGTVVAGGNQTETLVIGVSRCHELGTPRGSPVLIACPPLL